MSGHEYPVLSKISLERHEEERKAIYSVSADLYRHGNDVLYSAEPKCVSSASTHEGRGKRGNGFEPGKVRGSILCVDFPDLYQFLSGTQTKQGVRSLSYSGDGKEGHPENYFLGNPYHCPDWSGGRFISGRDLFQDCGAGACQYPSADHRLQLYPEMGGVSVDADCVRHHFYHPDGKCVDLCSTDQNPGAVPE